jgi:N-acetylglucosamine kinase-like BadF-type ATPase
MSSFYLGVDGGQSSTRALIADEHGRIIGRGAAGPCNHISGSEAREKFLRAVEGCLNQAYTEAGLDASSVEFAAACLGFSGGPEDKEGYARKSIPSKKYKITHDADIALSGATGGGPGIVVIAGTGSMAFGRNEAGQTARAGGWGYVYGDEGSAFDLARQALRASLRCEEGWGPKTLLRDLLLSATAARDTNDVLHRFYTDEFPRNRVAEFGPLVTDAAIAGDEIAITILGTAAAQLAALAQGVFKQLFQNFAAVPVCYSGGVFRSDLVRINFADEIRRSFAHEVTPPRYSPAAGAVLEALRLNDNQSALSNVPESER